jgi:hypothetical protein
MRTTQHDLVELARICRQQSRAAPKPNAATELRRLAREYQERAAQLDDRGNSVGEGSGSRSRESL